MSIFTLFLVVGASPTHGAGRLAGCLHAHPHAQCAEVESRRCTPWRMRSRWRAARLRRARTRFTACTSTRPRSRCTSSRSPEVRVVERDRRRSAGWPVAGGETHSQVGRSAPGPELARQPTLRALRAPRPLGCGVQQLGRLVASQSALDRRALVTLACASSPRHLTARTVRDRHLDGRAHRKRHRLFEPCAAVKPCTRHRIGRAPGSLCLQLARTCGRQARGVSAGPAVRGLCLLPRSGRGWLDAWGRT